MFTLFRGDINSPNIMKSDIDTIKMLYIYVINMLYGVVVSR